MRRFTYLIILWCVAVKAEYCGKQGDKEYYCEEGHCCKDFKCCTYYQYYEMWWFWLLWIIIILLGCTCAYFRRNHLGPHARLTGYWFSLIQTAPARPANQPDNPTFKLPSYEEAIQIQLGPPEDNEGAPPPYGGFMEEQNCNSAVMSPALEEGENSPRDSPPEYTALIPQHNT